MRDDDEFIAQFNLNGFSEQGKKRQVKRLLEMRKLSDEAARRYNETGELTDPSLFLSLFSMPDGVFMLTHILAEKMRKENAEVIVSDTSSKDVYYLEREKNEAHVRDDISLLSSGNPDDVDKEIMHAEMRHKMRLESEEERLTWHNTTIVIEDENNCWPFYNQSEYQRNKNNIPRILQMTQSRLYRCQTGRVAGLTYLQAEINLPTVLRLIEVGAKWEQKVEVQNQELQKKRSSQAASQTSSNVVDRAVSMSKDKHKVIQNRPLPSDPPAYTRFFQVDSARASEEALQTQKEKAFERLLVTEHIKLCFPSRKCCYILNRTSGLRFHAAVRNDDDEHVSEAKQVNGPPRVHWLI